MSAIEIMNKGMNCLTEQLGVVEAEKFISILIREKFDYTKWQENLFDNMTPEQINEDARRYFAEHPYKGNAKVVL